MGQGPESVSKVCGAAAITHAVTDPTRPFTIEFYEDPRTGRPPVYEWIVRDLSPYQRRALGTAMSEVLQRYGVEVCGTEYGKHLGDGLFEFRLRHDSDEIIAKHTDKTPDDEPDEAPIFLRVFCHAYGQRIVLLLGGYDKGRYPSDRRQDKEILLARKRLGEMRARKRCP